MLAAVFVAATPRAAAAQDDEGTGTGVVLTLDQPSVDELSRWAAQSSEVSFRVEHTTALEPRDDSETIQNTLEAARELYGLAENLGCLGELRGVNTVDLLANGLRELAARAMILRAACLFKGGDEARARTALSQGAEASLPLSQAAADLGSDVQALVDDVLATQAENEEVTLQLTRQPASASVRIDGIPLRCTEATCGVPLRPGFHVVSASALGYVAYQGTLTLAESQAMDIVLVEADALESKRQLQEALAHGVLPDREDWLAAASRAFEARVVLLLRRNEDAVTAVLYDRASGALIRTRIMGGDASLTATADRVMTEWRMDIRPPLVRQPAFWASIGAVVAVGTAIGIFFAVREPQKDLILFP